nr:IS1634 family transposase [Candidatus Cardinium hertigii]
MKNRYQLIDVTLVEDILTIDQAKLSKGRFILATNQLDKEELPDQELLSTYKEQSVTESGFKFIKDHTFEVDSIFLKKPTRISTLMMVMTLCLMVYSIAQYYLRKELVSSNETILSQSGYATNRPSMQWVYRLFHGIHVI